MTNSFPRSLRLFSVALATLLIVACDNNSPVAPSASDFSALPGPSGALGATIQGQVNGLRGPSGTPSLASMADDDSVMVEVRGTGVMDVVDADGQFVLVGVPGSANVVLRVFSSTMDVTIALGAVSENETVTVVLAAVGNNVELVSETRESDDDSSDDISDDASKDDVSDDDSADDVSDDDSSDDVSDDDVSDDDSADDVSDDDSSDDVSDDDSSDDVSDDDSEDDDSEDDDDVSDDDSEDDDSED